MTWSGPGSMAGFSPDLLHLFDERVHRSVLRHHAVFIDQGTRCQHSFESLAYLRDYFAPVPFAAAFEHPSAQLFGSGPDANRPSEYRLPPHVFGFKP